MDKINRNKHLEPNDLCWCGSHKLYKDCHFLNDKKLASFRNNHKAILPTRDMYKTPEQIEGIKKAAVVNNAVLDYVEANIREGVSTEDINTWVHTKTLELGGIPAPLNYEGFPKSVCTSVNDVVCHGIPNKKQILRSGDIINVDCTTIVNGYYADASRMFIIGKVSDEVRHFVETVKESLDLCVKNLKPYMQMGDLGYMITKLCHDNGYTVVREIGGHGVGVDFHEEPYVSHVGKKGEGLVFMPGMVFTIEPMVNMGKRYVWQDARDGWTVRTQDGSLSAQFEYTVLMTEEGLEIIAH